VKKAMAPDQLPASRPQVPSDIKAFNQKLIEEFRANRGQLSGPMSGRTLMLLTTTGAKSGKPRTTVLGYRTDRDQYVVIASGNGAPEHPAWYRNLLANPRARVEVGAETFEVRATTAAPGERARLAALVPYLKDQQAKTSREIPIVVLSRKA
jgi:deazaflavin-dependent oxidoreductase (nitroreductase family)